MKYHKRVSQKYEIMNLKIPTVLLIATAAQFPVFGASSAAVTAPFIVTAPSITSHDLQLRVATERDVGLLRSPTDQVLANRFQAEFKAKGFPGNVDFLSANDTPSATLPLLEIKLADWRAKPGAPPDCRFFATFTNAQGMAWLGEFEGFAAPLTAAATPEERVDGLRHAATQAVDELYQDLNARRLLEGASP